MRRIIHSALQNDRFVTTKSEGEEPFRHVIIFMKRKERKNFSKDESYTKKDVQNNIVTSEVEDKSTENK